MMSSEELEFVEFGEEPKYDKEMTMNLIHMANRLDSSTNQESLNYILLGKPHKEKKANHPTYMEMIQGAIRAINNGKGSSRTEILKYIAQNYHVTENIPKVHVNLNAALKKGVNSGDLEQTRERSGSFTMSSEREKHLQVMPINRSTPIKMLEEVRKNIEKPAKKQSALKKRSQKIAKIKKVAPALPPTTMQLRNRKPNSE